ncbi:MAG: tetratricopeptide repeat protein [Thermodesulfobacteriota bacterium]
MKLVWIFVLTIFAIVLGCVAAPDKIKVIYERQDMLEAKIENISKGIQDIQEMEKKRNQEIKMIQERIDRVYAKLNKRLIKLEKTSGSEETDSLGSPLVQSPDVLYLKAESYYQEGKYADAILEFQRFIDTYPQDKRAPTSYLKQGLSLIKIGRKEEAKFFLETLIDKFPKSEEAKIAGEKLRELSG